MREGFLTVRDARLYYCEVGGGMPLIVLHGGPDFDHFYLRPEMDALSERFRLIYYDQRGRGRSAGGVEPIDVTIESEVEDLDCVRQWFGFDTVTLLGHSWGALLALEYVAAHPDRVRRLILMNPAPATNDDREQFRLRREAFDRARLYGMRKIAETPEYQAGDLEADARYYRLHFAGAVPDQALVDRIVSRLRLHFSHADILKARAIEQLLYDQTWLKADYDVLARVAERANVPTLVIHGERDMIPVQCAEHMERVLPGARLKVLRDCGHFAYLEQPREVRAAIQEFLSVDRWRPDVESWLQGEV
jgi:proline iminopeptidase